MKEKRNFSAGRNSLRLACLLSLWLLPTCLWAISALEEAENLLREDKLEQARLLLEDALNADPKNEKVYNYLGVVYEVLGDNKKAISVMQRGLDFSASIKHILYDNIGNNFFRLGENVFAEEMYSNAIAINSTYAAPYLNRANARCELKKYMEAVSDYERFLILLPGTPKRPEIEAMIALLKGLIIEQDKKKAEELAKEKALMDEIMNSLKNASEDTKNLSVDSKVILDEKVGDVDIDE